jgi:hypothetical protein
MGTSQSSHAKYGDKASSASKKKDLKKSTSGRGRKTQPTKSEKKNQKNQNTNHAPHGLVGSLVSHHSDDVHHPDFDFSDRISEHNEHEIVCDLNDIDTTDAVHTDDNSSLADASTADFESDSDDEEEDEEWEERLRILEDARKLKEVAKFFLHPEAPVDNTYSSRCFFDRISAPPRISREEANEQAAIMEDLKNLKKQAVYYMHPEHPIENEDPNSFGRNYFSRPSAAEQESPEDAEERARILADARTLKQSAVDFLHPELPVVISDPTACGRNYFSRPSAPEFEDENDAEERDQIMEDIRVLKEAAKNYMHPEIPVVTSDPTACGRNYFERLSAPECLSQEEAVERSRILEDMKHMKKLAVDYMHPEIPVVTTDPAACGRNYFTRHSAPEYDDAAAAEEREASWRT